MCLPAGEGDGGSWQPGRGAPGQAGEDRIRGSCRLEKALRSLSPSTEVEESKKQERGEKWKAVGEGRRIKREEECGEESGREGGKAVQCGGAVSSGEAGWGQGPLSPTLGTHTHNADTELLAVP